MEASLFRILCIISLWGFMIIWINGTSKEWQEQALKEHNKYRSKHGASGLTNDPKLTTMSQGWATKLANNGGKLEHSKNTNIGENLYSKTFGGPVPPEPSAVEAIKAWYDEIKEYTGKFSSGTGHFSQLVWKATKTLGCSFAVKGNTQVVVCNYSPAGNVQGKFKENVEALGIILENSKLCLICCSVMSYLWKLVTDVLRMAAF